MDSQGTGSGGAKPPCGYVISGISVAYEVGSRGGFMIAGSFGSYTAIPARDHGVVSLGFMIVASFGRIRPFLAMIMVLSTVGG